MLLVGGEMIAYKTKAIKTSGSNLGEVYKSAKKIFNIIEKSTKRQPYLRSAYFKKEKIFFDYFWKHLGQKGPKERFKRLKYFQPALELIKYSRNDPTVKTNPNNKNETLYRFAGSTKLNELFIVQIKEDKKAKKKYFMSCFQVE